MFQKKMGFFGIVHESWTLSKAQKITYEKEKEFGVTVAHF